MPSNSEHWNEIFSSTDDSNLGWYEEKPTQLIALLNKIENWQGASIFVSGAGTCTLVEELLAQQTHLVLNDISSEALNSIKARIGEQQESVYWLCQDISQPINEKIPELDIWIDRAVLHFLTEEKQIVGYFDNLKNNLKEGAYALFAEFSKQGAEMCAGLAIHQYSVDELSERLGNEFELVSSFEYLFTNPSGDKKPYIYALYWHRQGKR